VRRSRRPLACKGRRGSGPNHVLELLMLCEFRWFFRSGSDRSLRPFGSSPSHTPVTGARSRRVTFRSRLHPPWCGCRVATGDWQDLWGHFRAHRASGRRSLQGLCSGIAWLSPSPCIWRVGGAIEPWSSPVVRVPRLIIVIGGPRGCFRCNPVTIVCFQSVDIRLKCNLGFKVTL
jgi:hypothetical protein